MFRTVARVTGCALALFLINCSTARAGCSWAIFPTINPYPTGNQLIGVAGTGEGDIWEVGAAFHQKGSRGYALHWSGSGWSTYLETDSHGHGGQLSGVAVLAPKDAWMVGAQYPTERYNAPLAMIEHWDGAAYARSSPPPPSQMRQPSSTASPASVHPMSGLSVGRDTFVRSWKTATSFTGTVPPGRCASSPNVPNNSTNLVAVAGTSGTDVWSVGDYYGNPSSNYRTLAEHWDGNAWTIVSTPNVTGHSGRLNAVVAITPGDAWAVGQYVDGAKRVPLTEHWDGTQWSIVSAPDPNGGSVFLLGIAALASNDVWAVGEISTGEATVATYTMHWNGKAWKPGKSANVRGKPVTLLNAVSVVPGAGLWAAGGDANKKAVIDTVTERYACSKEQSASPR